MFSREAIFGLKKYISDLSCVLSKFNSVGWSERNAKPFPIPVTSY
jgi:hypothetical protein